MSELGRNPERPPGAQPPPAPGAGRPPGAAPPGAAPPSGTAPRPPLPPAAALASLAAALLGAVAVAGSRIGLGLVLCAAAIGVAGRLGHGRRFDGWQRTCAVLAGALAAAALLRDAAWVVLPALLAATLLMSLAVAPATGWAGVVSGLARAVPRLGSGPLAVAAAGRGLLPGGGRLTPALRGIALAGALVAVFGALFASSDAAFERVVATALPDLRPDTLVARVFWGAAALALAGALATAVRRHEPETRAAARRLAPVEWGIALGALVLLFAVFVAVQASVLFGDHRHVLDTAGLTYAEYAREGFAQLVVAAALTLAVAGGALRWARAEGRAGRVLLRVLLALLCALTLVILVAAAHRLDLYQEAFGATRPRLAAGAAIAWLGALLALVLAAAAAGRYGLLPRACVLASALTLAGFVLADPDRRIAERNVERHGRDGRIDLEYARGLSADAAPALAKLPPQVREQALARSRARLAEGDGWAGWNAARSRAREALREAPAETGALRDARALAPAGAGAP